MFSLRLVVLVPFHQYNNLALGPGRNVQLSQNLILTLEKQDKPRYLTVIIRRYVVVGPLD